MKQKKGMERKFMLQRDRKTKLSFCRLASCLH